MKARTQSDARHSGEDRNIDPRERREQILRNIGNSMTRGALEIPPHLIPRDKDLRWVRTHTRNQEDTFNLQTAISKGWEIMPASAYPEIASPYGMIGADGMAYDGGIHFKDAVLCMRDKEYGELERAKITQFTNTQVRGLPGIESLMQNDPTFRVNSNDVTTSQMMTVKNDVQGGGFNGM